jgi:hypothetical protein
VFHIGSLPMWPSRCGGVLTFSLCGVPIWSTRAHNGSFSSTVGLYRCIVTTLSAGGQNSLQSFFAHGSDQRCSSNEILYYAGAVAATRSGNERFVRHAKQSCVIKRGATFRTFHFVLLAEKWLEWRFQVNFMHDQVY